MIALLQTVLGKLDRISVSIRFFLLLAFLAWGHHVAEMDISYLDPVYLSAYEIPLMNCIGLVTESACVTGNFAV